MKDVEDGHRVLRLLEEISTGDDLTQRDLSNRAGIALGLVNTYLKNLASKGFVKISAIPAKRYKYYLTPKGFVEKTRLTYAMLQNYTHVFREARRDFAELFSKLKADGVKKVIFAGLDETAEIAYLSLQEVGIEFAGIVDPSGSGRKFFGHTVNGMDFLHAHGYGVPVVITTISNADKVYGALTDHGVAPENIMTAYPSGGGDRSHGAKG